VSRQTRTGLDQVAVVNQNKHNAWASSASATGWHGWWRHRFITDTWGWEIPTGIVDDGEIPQETAAREVEEETAWRSGPLRPIVYSQPSNGISNSERSRRCSTPSPPRSTVTRGLRAV
jgi:8-oxo-dGTP pyrophosphatase MutT (NUDIX family)